MKIEMKRQFFAKDISLRHPMHVANFTDIEYADVANTVYYLIGNNVKDISDTARKEIAIKIALYLEDIVSDSGLWVWFVNKHKSLYGKELPFYDVGEDYYLGEPNLQDIQYLLWSGVMENRSASIINPETPALVNASLIVFEYVDSMFEQVPINEKLVETLYNADIYENFLLQRDMLKWVYLDCYLTRGRFSDKYLEQQEEVFSSIMDGIDDSQAYYAAESTACYEFKTGPLALYPKEYLAGILRNRGMNSFGEKVENQEYNSVNIYKLESWNADNVVLLSTSGSHLSVRTSSFNVGIEKTLATESYCVGTFVRYDKEWYANGLNSWGNLGKPFDELSKKTDVPMIPEKEFKALLKKTEGKRLFFARDIAEIKKIYNSFGIEFDPDMEIDTKRFEYAVIFIHSNTNGICAVGNAARIVKSPDNPYYDHKLSVKEALSPIVNEKSFPGELVHFLIDNGLLPDAALNSIHGPRRGNALVQENMDFMARFFRQDSYSDN